MRLTSSKTSMRHFYNFCSPPKKCSQILKSRTKIFGSLVKIYINGSFLDSIPTERGSDRAILLHAITTQPLLAFLNEEHAKGWLEAGHPNFQHSPPLQKDLCHQYGHILILENQQCFNKIENSISLYERALGEKLNIKKSIVIPIGLRTIPQWLIDKGCIITQHGQITRYLGVPLGTSMTPIDIKFFYLDRVGKQIAS